MWRSRKRSRMWEILWRSWLQADQEVAKRWSQLERLRHWDTIHSIAIPLHLIAPIIISVLIFTLIFFTSCFYIIFCCYITFLELEILLVIRQWPKITKRKMNIIRSIAFHREYHWQSIHWSLLDYSNQTQHLSSKCSWNTTLLLTKLMILILDNLTQFDWIIII